MGCETQLAAVAGTQIERGKFPHHGNRSRDFEGRGCPEEFFLGGTNSPVGKCLVKSPGENVRIPVQDYKSLRTAAMICDTLVNTQTHSQTYKQTAFDRLAS